MKAFKTQMYYLWPFLGECRAVSLTAQQREVTFVFHHTASVCVCDLLLSCQESATEGTLHGVVC
jgi:hypothetical protein